MNNIDIDELGGASYASGTSKDAIRDEAFAMNAYLYINDNDFSAINTTMLCYVNFA